MSKKSEFKMLHDNVLIKKKPVATKTESGLYVSPTNTGAKGAPIEGIVISCGPGRYNAKGELVKPDVEPGDQVIFAQTDLRELKQMGDEFVVVPSSEILLRLRPDEPIIPAGPIFNLS